MTVQPSRGFCKIKFFNALALAFSIAAGICPALLTGQNVGESMVPADSGVQAPIFNENLPDRATADDRDRLRDLYSDSELDRYSKEPETTSRSLIDQLKLSPQKLSISCRTEEKTDKNLPLATRCREICLPSQNPRPQSLCRRPNSFGRLLFPRRHSQQNCPTFRVR